ncbi:acyltransferase family protein [Marinobacter sp.]|uniref:acyltransferase family protein n=1 Tax=Marinobacter sp. TaxID=50741 RepID=UPI00384E79AE
MSALNHRLESLDALRGVAALIVVLFHFVPWYHRLYGHEFTPWPVLDFGRYGVHLFFMLSGFVIFMTLTRTPTAGWFALARGFRLLPALWLSIAITMVSVYLMGPEDRSVSLSAALANLTLMHEYLGYPHVDGAYWSLVIEVTFYFWIALFFYTLGNGRALQGVFWGWVLVSYGAVIYWGDIPPGLEFLLKDLLFTRYAPLFISGMLFYRWHSHGRPPLWEKALLVLAMTHCLLAYKAPFNLFVLGSYGVFVLAITGRLDWLAHGPLLWLGRISYALYLVHQNVGYGIMGVGYGLGLPGWLNVVIALAVAIGLATGIHHGIERPALAWFRRRRPGGAPLAPTTELTPP